MRTEEGIITEGSTVTWDKNAILWALPQPILVASSVILVAAMLINEWGGEYYRVWTLLVAVSATPFLLIAERFWARKSLGYSARRNGRGPILDGFWRPALGAIVSDMYRTPVSDGFLALRDMSPLQIEFQPTTVLGLIAMLVIRFTSSFSTTGCIGFSMNPCFGGVCTQRITT